MNERAMLVELGQVAYRTSNEPETEEELREELMFLRGEVIRLEGQLHRQGEELEAAYRLYNQASIWQMTDVANKTGRIEDEIQDCADMIAIANIEERAGYIVQLLKRLERLSEARPAFINQLRLLGRLIAHRVEDGAWPERN